MTKQKYRISLKAVQLYIIGKETDLTHKSLIKFEIKYIVVHRFGPHIIITYQITENPGDIL